MRVPKGDIVLKLFHIVLVGLALTTASLVAIGNALSIEPAIGCGRKETDAMTRHEAAGERRILFIHHSCGTAWMERGLVAALEDPKNLFSEGKYSFHDAQYGSYLGEGDGTLGRDTDLRDWYVKFREDLDRPGELVDMLNCDRQDETYRDSRQNEIIMFKSCYPNSNIGPADTSIDLDDQAVRAEWLDPNRGGYYNGRWRYRDENHINYVKAAYTGLLDIFREHPEVLFIAVTAPAMHYSAYGADNSSAHRSRGFNNWLRTEWLNGYQDKNGHVNVAVFDWFREHAYSDDPTSPNYWLNFIGKPGHEALSEANHEQFVDTLRLDYASEGGDSHPNQAADEWLTKVFVETFINQAYDTWKRG